jgi:type III restriction enzyme
MVEGARPSVLIENPILNSPYEEPTRHFRFDDSGITDEVVEGRRPSSYFVPIPAAKKRGGQLALPAEWTADRVEVSENVNRIRERVARWRAGGWTNVTPTTRRLLQFWTAEDRERKLFFCQVEALETAIYLTEVAAKVGDAWIVNQLADEAQRHNPGLARVAMKMATGSGKTVVMAMLVAWQVLNKAANPQDARFSDKFLVVAPGITIRDRLRVLLPSDPGNYYRERDLVPPDLVDELGRARIVITNFHGFMLRESKAGKVARLTKTVLNPDGANPFLESPDQMARRVCRELGAGRNQIVVLNDEAHHCYARRGTAGTAEGNGSVDGERFMQEALKGDAKREADHRNEEAMVWVSGLQSVNAKLGVKAVYDLSATPFFLAGSGYPEGKLFPWVVSDFSLTDAIESGIVKIPRVPVSDNAMAPDGVTYRNLWARISDQLPKKNRRTAAVEEGAGVLRLPAELQGALHSLYEDYARSFARWEERASASPDGAGTPPVFIVVCNNTAVSKMVFDYVAGFSKPAPGGLAGEVLVPGELALFSNVEGNSWAHRPNTILVDSEQLESGDAMSEEFKRIAAVEIAEFKAEYRERFPGRDPDALTDEDLLREVLNTVGKPDRLGEHVRCVVSVSMLTEGWDANTVTHILGVRAFGTQLLCEQVVGRGLRRRSYVVNDDGRFEPEYAEVYGVPFSFIPTAGADGEPPVVRAVTRVRALAERASCEIRFPRVAGYRYVFDREALSATFGPGSRLTLSTKDLPTETEIAGVVGESETHTLAALQARRLQEVAFFLTRRLIQQKFRDAEGDEETYLFPRLLPIVRRWMDTCVVLKDDTFPQLLAIHRIADDAVSRIHRAIVREQSDKARIEAVLQPDGALGSSAVVDFDTTRQVLDTSPYKCHVNVVVLDSNYEAKVAQSLESMDEVVRYVKNDHLGFVIPYTIDGQQRSFLPDYVVVIDEGPRGSVNLVLEVSGPLRRDKAEKVATARNCWVPAVNASGLGLGRWEFLETRDPWNVKSEIRAYLRSEKRRA